MSSFEGLTQLADHHRFSSFGAAHRRSDSVESHGSISSLSSNHSSIGNGACPSMNALGESSKFRRVEPPRTLNMYSHARNSSLSSHQAQREAKLKSARPHGVLLHSTSVMEAPGRQQTLNRTRSGSCPIVWEANGSLHDRPMNGIKQCHAQANFAVSPSTAYGPRYPDRPFYGHVTGSVQYAGSQHDDCRGLGGSKMLQSGMLTPTWRSGDRTYERPRAIERCPTEDNLTSSVQSPSTVVSSLQRSLSTMSMNVVPNSSFTSKLNCNLSRSQMSRLNDLARKSEESIAEPKQDARNGRRPNFLHTKSPSVCDMGIDYNIPKAGHVRRQKEMFEKDNVKNNLFSQRNGPLCNRGQYKHRSYENISSASSACLTPIETKPNGQPLSLTPVENRFEGRLHASHSAKEIKRERTPLRVSTSCEAKRGGRLLPLTPIETSQGSLLNTRIAAEYGQRNNRLNAMNSQESEPDETPETPSPEKVWNWSPLKSFNCAQQDKKIGGSLTSLRSVCTTAISDGEFEPKTPDATLGNRAIPRAIPEKSKFVSEMFVNITKPRPLSGIVVDKHVGILSSGQRPLTSSLSSHDLPSRVTSSSSSAARSSLPSAVPAALKTPSDPKPLSAVLPNRRHSNPTEKSKEASTDVKAYVANQKESFKLLLNDLSNLYQYRDKLKTCVLQMEKEMQERRHATAGQFPSPYDLEKLYETNMQLRMNNQQLTRDIELAKSHQNLTKKSCDEGEDDGRVWSCTACTFINHPALNRCECCELPKLPFVMR